MGQFSLADILSKSSYLVCLTGREMMVEDGIDSMRDMKTAYEIELKYGYSPEEVFSAQFFSTRPEQFYEFYRSEVLAQAKEPGKAYGALAALEKTGILKCVITRQLFNLEKRAGCQNVYNLHGNIYENNHCPRCGRIYPMDYMKRERFPVRNLRRSGSSRRGAAGGDGGDWEDYPRGRRGIQSRHASDSWKQYADRDCAAVYKIFPGRPDCPYQRGVSFRGSGSGLLPVWKNSGLSGRSSAGTETETNRKERVRFRQAAGNCGLIYI